MKNKIVLSLLIVLQIFVVACNKSKLYNPDDLLFNLYVDVNLRPEAKYILILENTQSIPQSLSLSSSFYEEIKRGEDIIGGAVNLHFVLINEFASGDLSIKSFYDVPFGKTIRITDDNLKQTESTNSTLNLSFANIPPFDIISRTAKSQNEAFTLNTFETPITTAALGGETFETIEMFYACFQNGDEASYKLEWMPDQADYTIDFTNLNSNMLKHTYAKIMDEADIVHASVQAWDNAILDGKPVGIFDLEDFSIFPTSTFDVFIPTFERYFSYYVQDFQFEKNNQTFTNWFYSSTMFDEINLLDAGLKVTTELGQMPVIESLSDEYSIAEITFETEGFKWTLHSQKTDNIYFPEIPSELFSDFPDASNLIQVFLSLEKGKVKLIDYYPYTNYDEVLGIYFGSDINRLKAGNYFRTQEQVFEF